AAELDDTGGVELELPLELQAAAPASRQAPTAATRHLEPVDIRRDIPVKRTIAPCRLSAVNSPVSGPSSARGGPHHGAAHATGRSGPRHERHGAAGVQN